MNTIVTKMIKNKLINMSFSIKNVLFVTDTRNKRNKRN
jgi:hypothetical protein